MKKIIKENVRLILGSLSVLVYIGFVVRRMVMFSDFIDRVNGLDLTYEEAPAVLEAGTGVLAINIVVYTLVLTAVLFLIYKRQ